eukprot:SM000224S07107  [mRNA]  locus=s224:109193:115584:- [translate_table: standard]
MAAMRSSAPERSVAPELSFLIRQSARCGEDRGCLAAVRLSERGCARAAAASRRARAAATWTAADGVARSRKLAKAAEQLPATLLFGAGFHRRRRSRRYQAVCRGRTMDSGLQAVAGASAVYGCTEQSRDEGETLQQLVILADSVRSLKEAVSVSDRGGDDAGTFRPGLEMRDRVDRLSDRISVLQQYASQHAMTEGRVPTQVTATLKALQREHISLANIIRMASEAAGKSPFRPRVERASLSKRSLYDEDDRDEAVANSMHPGKGVNGTPGTGPPGMPGITTPIRRDAEAAVNGHTSQDSKHMASTSTTSNTNSPAMPDTQARSPGPYSMTSTAGSSASPLAAFRAEIERRVVEQLAGQRLGGQGPPPSPQTQTASSPTSSSTPLPTMNQPLSRTWPPANVSLSQAQQNLNGQDMSSVNGVRRRTASKKGDSRSETFQSGVESAGLPQPQRGWFVEPPSGPALQQRQGVRPSVPGGWVPHMSEAVGSVVDGEVGQVRRVEGMKGAAQDVNGRASREHPYGTIKGPLPGQDAKDLWFLGNPHSLRAVEVERKARILAMDEVVRTAEVERLREELERSKWEMKNVRQLEAIRADKAEGRVRQLEKELAQKVPMELHAELVKKVREPLVAARLEVVQLAGEVREKEALLGSVKSELLQEREHLVEKVRALTGDAARMVTLDEMKTAVKRAAEEVERELVRTQERAAKLVVELERKERALHSFRAAWGAERQSMVNELNATKERLAALEKERFEEGPSALRSFTSASKTRQVKAEALQEELASMESEMAVLDFRLETEEGLLATLETMESEEGSEDEIAMSADSLNAMLEQESKSGTLEGNEVGIRLEALAAEKADSAVAKLVADLSAQLSEVKREVKTLEKARQEAEEKAAKRDGLAELLARRLRKVLPTLPGLRQMAEAGQLGSLLSKLETATGDANLWKENVDGAVNRVEAVIQEASEAAVQSGRVSGEVTKGDNSGGGAGSGAVKTSRVWWDVASPGEWKLFRDGKEVGNDKQQDSEVPHTNDAPEKSTTTNSMVMGAQDMPAVEQAVAKVDDQIGREVGEADHDQASAEGALVESESLEQPAVEEQGGTPEMESEVGRDAALVSDAVPAASSITLLYETGWEQAYIHYSADYGSWTEPPGLLMEDVGEGVKTVTIPAATLEFVITNGSGSWDSSPGSSNYLIEEEGHFHLSSGRISRLGGES